MMSGHLFWLNGANGQGNTFPGIFPPVPIDPMVFSKQQWGEAELLPCQHLDWGPLCHIFLSQHSKKWPLWSVVEAAPAGVCVEGAQSCSKSCCPRAVGHVLLSCSNLQKTRVEKLRIPEYVAESCRYLGSDKNWANALPRILTAYRKHEIPVWKIGLVLPFISQSPKLGPALAEYYTFSLQ